MRNFAADFSRRVVKKFWKILASSIWRGFFDVRLLNQCVKTCLRTKRRSLRFARNLRPHCFGEGNRVEHFSDFWRFCLLLRSRGPILEPAVEHFFNFSGFCSTFEVARAGFGAGGRTFFRFWRILFYFQSRAGRIWSRR